jgi:hypothetical protein
MLCATVPGEADIDSHRYLPRGRTEGGAMRYGNEPCCPIGCC